MLECADIVCVHMRSYSSCAGYFLPTWVSSLKNHAHVTYYEHNWHAIMACAKVSFGVCQRLWGRHSAGVGVCDQGQTNRVGSLLGHAHVWPSGILRVVSFAPMPYKRAFRNSLYYWSKSSIFIFAFFSHRCIDAVTPDNLSRSTRRSPRALQWEP